MNNSAVFRQFFGVRATRICTYLRLLDIVCRIALKRFIKSYLTFKMAAEFDGLEKIFRAESSQLVLSLQILVMSTNPSTSELNLPVIFSLFLYILNLSSRILTLLF
jgi:hypothetical protein